MITGHPRLGLDPPKWVGPGKGSHTLNLNKVLLAQLSLSSGTCICMKAGSCNRSAALPRSTSTLCTSKLLMHKVRIGASWCGVITLDGLMGGKDMGSSISCIASLLSRVLMVFIWARTVAARSNFFL